MNAKFVEFTNINGEKETVNVFYVSKINYDCRKNITRIWIMNRDICSTIQTFENYDDVVKKISEV